MAYRHEVYRAADFTGMRHFRQEAQPSGLIVVKEIARTLADIDPSQEEPSSSGLIIARNLGEDVAVFSDKYIECPDIDTFVAAGVAEWTYLLSRLGKNAVRVTLSAAEIRAVEETATPSGLVIPSDPEVVLEFKGYTATPAELEALESMIHRANIGIPDVADQPGNYL